ncbi:MAG: hypothetical protein ACAH59_02940 [Pseudobdellovibrionaceae bacterium]
MKRFFGWAFTFALILSPKVEAKSRFSFSGKSYHRFFQYTDNDDLGPGFDNWLFAQQKAEFNSSFAGRAQIYAFAGNSKADLIQAQDNVEQRKEISEVWPGDIYLQAATGPALLRLGYQQISWQEGIGLSYTNFINARDYRASLFDPPDQVYRSAPAANLILSGEHLSLQVVYMPFAQHDLAPPFSRWARVDFTLVPGQTVQVENPENFESSQDAGGRLTWAGEGFDISAFYFSLADRKLTYTVAPTSTITDIELIGDQKKISPRGLTTSFSVFDFLFRLEYMEVPQRRWNRLDAGTLSTVDLDEKALTLGLDSPAWDKFSFSLQASVSSLAEDVEGLEREQVENLSFASLNYTFRTDTVLQAMALYHESDRSLFQRYSFSWPVTKTVEMALAYEASAGPENSQGAVWKDLNRGFLQLNHAF